MENCIEIRNIEKRFGERQVLKGISLTIGRGEIFGLLGPSGAGKTTLIKLLTGQQRPTSGTAGVLGRDTSDFDRKSYAAFGMVLDNTGLYERMTCYENLTLFASLYGLKKNRVRDMLEKTGLWEAARRPVSKLSKGMRQRLALARALLHEPQLLFLDEPTSGLDPATAVSIYGLLREEREKGSTIFLTTHNMEEAQKLCGRVALLHEGRIVACGRPDELCRQYNHQRSIHILLKSGETITLPNESGSAEKIRACFAEDRVESIRSSEPTLETVFLELTGRGLEE